MVGGMRILSRSLRHYKPKASIVPENSLTPRPNQWLYQTRRTLILESAPSQSVKLHRLSDSDSGIVEVSLERPQVRNAIGKDMLKGLQNTFDAISNDASANVLLIRSKVPKVFCAGADLKERKMMSASEVRDFVNKLRAAFTVLEVLPIPTIAVIEGAALGGGLEMALSCDLRICGEDAVLGLPETGLAIIPGDRSTSLDYILSQGRCDTATS